MTTYIIRRLLIVPLQLFGLSVMIFGMILLIPVNERASLYITNESKSGYQIDMIIRHYELDAPMYKQYWNWLMGKEDPRTGEIRGGILRGNFGYSVSGAGKVDEMILDRFPATLELALFSFFPIIIVGMWLGVKAAVKHNTFIDQLLRISSTIAASFPAFVLGLFMVMVFYVRLDWLQTGRYSQWVMLEIISGNFQPKTGMLVFDSIAAGRMDILWDVIRHMIMPIVVLPYISWATFVRVTRSSMLEALGQDYILTAHAKGLSEREVVRKHALPNALLPVTTMSAFTLISLLSGVVITEAIFNYPGIGLTAAQAAINMDAVTILGFALFNGLILIFTNLIVDILYCVIDPRVQITG